MLLSLDTIHSVLLIVLYREFSGCEILILLVIDFTLTIQYQQWRKALNVLVMCNLSVNNRLWWQNVSNNSSMVLFPKYFSTDGTWNYWNHAISNATLVTLWGYPTLSTCVSTTNEIIWCITAHMLVPLWSHCILLLQITPEKCKRIAHAFIMLTKHVR